MLVTEVGIDKKTGLESYAGFRSWGTILFMRAVPVMSAESFRYRGAARDGGTLEYVFESDERDVPKRVTKEHVAEIAADFMTSFYVIQVGTLETQEFRQQPIPFWLESFSDTLKSRVL